MYASFLLKYSKSYLHTCIIFYMFIPFFFFLSFNATRADVSCPSRVSGFPSPSPLTLPERFFETRCHPCPFLSLLLSVNQRFLPFARFVRHRSSTMNTVRYASAIRERKEKKRGGKKEEEKGCLANLGNWHVRLRVYMYVRVRTWACVCVCVFVWSVYVIYARVSVCV